MDAFRGGIAVGRHPEQLKETLGCARPHRRHGKSGCAGLGSGDDNREAKTPLRARGSATVDVGHSVRVHTDEHQAEPGALGDSATRHGENTIERERDLCHRLRHYLCHSLRRLGRGSLDRSVPASWSHCGPASGVPVAAHRGSGRRSPAPGGRQQHGSGAQTRPGARQSGVRPVCAWRSVPSTPQTAVRARSERAGSAPVVTCMARGSCPLADTTSMCGPGSADASSYVPS